MKFFTDAELQRLLDPGEVISALRSAFVRGFADLQMPPRSHLEVENGTVLIMACAFAGDPICGVKIVSVSRKPRPRGRVNATYLLIDSRSGETVCLLDANYLTDIRTAATTALATDLLARQDASVLGIFGTGRQAEAHIAVLPRVRNFQKALVVGTSLAKARDFAKTVSVRYAIDIEVVDAKTCVTGSDVVCTCTSSTEPLFSGDWVRPGAHFNLIGTYQPHAQEVDSMTIQRARVFVDSYAAALEEAGDILIPLRACDINREHIRGDLHELTSGAKPGRLNAEDVTVFKSVGLALEDLVTAKLVLPFLLSNSRTDS
jgi:ornithine cyclodeaminase/alanine dehydrogenase